MGKKKNADFQKVKLKVGRTVKRSAAFTNTSFKAKKIKLRKSQIENVLNTASNSLEGKTFQELLKLLDQPGHARLGAATKIGKMMAVDPGLAGPEAVEALLQLGMSGGSEEKKASLQALRHAVGSLGAAGRVIGAHLGAGLVNYRASTRLHSLDVLQILINGQPEMLRKAQPLTLISRLLCHLEPAALRPLEGLLTLAAGLPPNGEVHHFTLQADPVDSADQWEPLLDKLCPPLLNCGLELAPENKLSSETSKSFLTFLKCWSRVLEISYHLGLLKKCQETYAATFDKFFLKEFPYISQLQTEGPSKSSDQEALVTKSNVRLACVCLHLHGKNVDHHSPLVGKLVRFVGEVCAATSCGTELAQQILLVLEYLVSTLAHPEGLFKHFMKSLMMLYKNSPFGHQLRHTIFNSLNQILFNHFQKLKNSHMVKVWVGAAPTKFAKLPPARVESCLDNMIRLVRLPHHHFPECQLAMQENLENFLSLLSSVVPLGERCTVGMVNLISLVPHLDRKSLKTLLSICQELQPNIVNHLVCMLARRLESSVYQAQLHQDPSHLLDADIPVSDFLAFLLVLTTGLSQESKETLPKLQQGDSLVFPSTEVDMNRHLDISEVALNEMVTLLPSDMLSPMVQKHVESIMSCGVKIPVHCALTTLSLLPRFPDMWSSGMARLARDLLLHLVLDPDNQGYPLTLLLETIGTAGIAPQILYHLNSLLQTEVLNLKMAKSMMLAMTQLAYCGLIDAPDHKKLLLRLLQMLKAQVPPADQERDWWVDMEVHLEMCCQSPSVH